MLKKFLNGGTVQYCHKWICKEDNLADFTLAVVNMTTKFTNFTVMLYFFMCMFVQSEHNKIVRVAIYIEYS